MLELTILTLYAATDAVLKNNDYIGPGGFLELWGHPAPASSSEASKDLASARELWEISERRTGIEYAFGRDSGRMSARA